MVTLAGVRASALLVGSDEDPYALSDAQFTLTARHLLADARRKAARKPSGPGPARPGKF
jgi:hypothetical protein